MHFFCNSRVGVCGICSPGQLPVPLTVGNLLVPVLSSLLLLLRALLLLSRHLLLSPALLVPTAWMSFFTPGPTESFNCDRNLLYSVWGRKDGQAWTPCSGSCLSLLHPRRPCRGPSCPFMSRRAEGHIYSVCGDEPGRRWASSKHLVWTNLSPPSFYILKSVSNSYARVNHFSLAAGYSYLSLHGYASVCAACVCPHPQYAMVSDWKLLHTQTQWMSSTT